MTTIELIITLPDNVAQSAKARGLLQPDSLAALIVREVVQQQSRQRLSTHMDRLAALDMPPLTAEEIAAEIEATRRERPLYRS
jgi:hypothetical protein